MPESEPTIVIPLSGWIALSEVLAEFVIRADAGQRARDAYSQCMAAVADANPVLKESQ